MKSSNLQKTNLDEQTAQNIYNKLLADKNKRNPTVKKNWGSDEVKLLEYAVRTYLEKKKQGEDKLTTHDWKEIANFIPGRTESQCLYKWNLTKHKVSFRKSTWQTIEDNILKELVKEYGKKHWQKIANELNQRMNNGTKRAGKQCRERWLNHLDDRIRKDPWSCIEDLELLKKQQIIGNKWSDIVKYLPGRTENMVKNRFNTLAKQKREEKRNSSSKKLDEVIDSLEEQKVAKDDKN
jgi:transcriptional activator Myb